MSTFRFAVAMGVLYLSACGDSPSDDGAPCGPGISCPAGQICQASDQLCRSAGVSDFITNIGVTASGAMAMVERGDPPAAGAGPTARVTSPEAAINGGTAHVTVEGSGAFDHVIVAVEGLPGYYLVALPVPVSSLELLITLAQDLEQTTFTLHYAIGNAGAIGAYAAVPATLVAVPTGEVQVSISWDAESDVDLHVIDPNGDEVYYGQRVVSSGGTLDLDSNAACAIDHVKNENITWETALSGTYAVRVDYFDSCEVAATTYVVTVQVKGQPTRTFSGTLTGAGDAGGAGSGVDTTTFEVP